MKKVTLEEIVDDIIYFSLSAFLSILATFIFDIHHSFYQDSLFPLKFVFKSKDVYLVSALAGGILGLVWIKFFLFALQKNTFVKIKRMFGKFKKAVKVSFLLFLKNMLS
jgi:hypothetical protein